MPVVATPTTSEAATPKKETLDRTVVERQIKILEALKAPASVIKMAQGFLSE